MMSWKFEDGKIKHAKGYNLASVNGHRTREGEAAGNLMAAAPNLLHELKTMYDFIIDRGYSAEDSDGMKAAKAAINKAEGVK